jgi:hypothetical protein
MTEKDVSLSYWLKGNINDKEHDYWDSEHRFEDWVDDLSELCIFDK